ncbi:putative choline kinase 2 [Zea mays]|uniref:Putative choline kinase 2 n=1 Tax=Zea mays TaxID=4577 RepID=A0A1D6LFH0_MAIZE|nr:putative choline kinase 2 [Zea mays]
MPGPNLCSFGGKLSLENQITTLENKCSCDYQWTGFCHNDLQNGNIIIDEKTNVLTIIFYDNNVDRTVKWEYLEHG